MTGSISTFVLTSPFRHDPPVSPRSRRFQRSLRSGHLASSASPRGSPLAHAPALSVPHPSPLRPATALPWWTMRWQCWQPAQWWVQSGCVHIWVVHFKTTKVVLYQCSGLYGAKYYTGCGKDFFISFFINYYTFQANPLKCWKTLG